MRDVHLSMTSVDLVRGALARGACLRQAGVTEKDLWRAYRAWAEAEPFVRLVKDRRGIYRVPEPKILAGSNYADVGFELDPDSGRRGGHGGDRQPDEGRGRFRGPVHEPDVRLRRDRRAGVSRAAPDLKMTQTTDEGSSMPVDESVERSTCVHGTHRYLCSFV